VRIALAAATSSTALPSPLQASAPRGSFLSILSSASENETPGNRSIDSRAQANAEAGTAAANRDGTGPEGVGNPSGNRQLSAAGERSNAQKNGRSSNQGPSEIGGRESSRTAPGATSVPTRSAVQIASSNLRPTQDIPAGNIVQQMLANLSEQEIATRALVDPGAQAIAGSGATNQPMTLENNTSLVATLGKGSTSADPIIAPVNQKVASILQKSGAQESGGWSRVGSFEAMNVELPNVTISSATSQLPEQTPISLSLQSNFAQNGSMPVIASSAIGGEDGSRGMLIDANAINPSAALVSDSSEKTPVQDGPSGNSSQGLQASNPLDEISGTAVLNPGANTDAQAVAENPIVALQESALLPLVPSNGAAYGAVILPSVDQGSAKADQGLSAQLNGSSTNDRSAETSTGNVAVHAVSAVQDVMSQLLASRSVTELAAPEKPTSTPKAPSAPVTQAAAIDGKSPTSVDSKSVPGNPSSSAASAAEQVLILPTGLPMAAAPMSSPSGNQAAENGAPKAAPSPNGSGNLALSSKSDTATSNTTNSANGLDGGSSQGGQNAQSSQGALVDPSRTAGAVPRTPDNGAFQAQTQAVPAQSALPESATAHRTSDGPDLPSLPSEHPDNPASVHSDSGEAVAASSINTAKLLQTMSETEMHVGMRSTEFGDISIRTSVSQQQLVTQISLDHSDLSQAISAHVSNLQTKLGEDYGLHASIEVHNLGSSHSGDSGQSSQGEQRAFTHSARFDNIPFQPEEEAGLSLAELAVAGDGNRLDIRA
jgi:hypothetical protein